MSAAPVGPLLDYELEARMASISEALASGEGTAAAQDALSELSDQLALLQARFDDLAEASVKAFQMVSLPGPGTQGLSLVGCQRVVLQLRAGFERAKVRVPGDPL